MKTPTYYQLENKCRISGEPISSSDVISHFDELPIPGLFFESAESARDKKIPMTLVKSKKAGFMQLSQTMDGSLYRFYKSGQSDANHFSWLENIAGQMSKHFDLVTPVLEVGGGKGFLLNQLKKAGFHNLFNVDPSDDNMDQEDFVSLVGLFPQGVDLTKYKHLFGCIIGQHFLEHVPNPVEVLKGASDLLAADGELWIEVPNMDIGEENCFVQASFFYPLHLNHFTRRTLTLAGQYAGLELISMELVDHYGKSLWAKFKKGGATQKSSCFHDTENLSAYIQQYFTDLKSFASKLPTEILCWGAAEKSHTILSILAGYGVKPIGIFDSNPDLQGLYLSGFSLQIQNRNELPFDPPHLLVLSPMKHREIVNGIKDKLSTSSQIHVPFVGHLTLRDYD